MARQCVICCSDETMGKLERLACSHSICAGGDCLESMFRQSIREERSYPARCCGQVLDVDAYEGRISLAVVRSYKSKEKEYSVPPKRRRYCAKPTCSQFLPPHMFEDIALVTFARCTSCQTLTCADCKLGLSSEPVVGDCQNNAGSRCQDAQHNRCSSCHDKLVAALRKHSCCPNEIDEKFKRYVKHKEFQECGGCGNAVELVKACNHIMCDCGHELCYVCGRRWDGRFSRCLHGCPMDGKATYDKEGYNQEGYHRDTGLNRNGLTRRESGIARVIYFDSDDDDDETDDEYELLMARLRSEGGDTPMAMHADTSAETIAAVATHDEAPNPRPRSNEGGDGANNDSHNVMQEDDDEDGYESQSGQSDESSDSDGAGGSRGGTPGDANDFHIPDSGNGSFSNEHSGGDEHATAGAVNNLSPRPEHLATTKSEGSVAHRPGKGGQWVDYGSDEEL